MRRRPRRERQEGTAVSNRGIQYPTSTLYPTAVSSIQYPTAVSNCVKNLPQSLPFLFAGNSRRGCLLRKKNTLEKYTLQSISDTCHSFQKNITSRDLRVVCKRTETPTEWKSENVSLTHTNSD